jgi:hypothetical protein
LLIEHAGNADALQLATGELVAAGKQLVGQIDAFQRGASAGHVERVNQRSQRFPGRPLAELAGQHGGYHALPAGNRRRLMDGADAGAQGAIVPVDGENTAKI